VLGVVVEQNSRVAPAFSARPVVLDQGRMVYEGDTGRAADDGERLAKLVGLAE
jgi:ABC-type branched-subunit amino acid transport system ATPase component